MKRSIMAWLAAGALLVAGLTGCRANEEPTGSTPAASSVSPGASDSAAESGTTVPGETSGESGESSVPGTEVSEPSAEPAYPDYVPQPDAYTPVIDPFVPAEDPLVFRVKDYGAKGDGETDDFAAVHRAVDAACASGVPAMVEFEKDAVYRMSDGGGANVIFDLQFQSDLTLKGDNSTIVMDMSKGLHTYVNINEGKNMAVQGLNFKTEKSVYAIADVERIDIANCTLDFKTDRSLGIDDSFSFAIGDCFGLPYTGKDINRMHMFFQQIEVLDASANRYRIQFINRDDLQNKMKYMQRTGCQFLVPVPNWGQKECGAFVVTHTTNLLLQDINMWSASHFHFHMRYNYGDFQIRRVNLTPEPGTDMAMVGWRDGFHMKENRARITWEDCFFEKVFDDVFNLSCTMMRVSEVISDTEFKIYCQEFGGTYWMPLRAGDRVTLYNEKTGRMVGRTTIKEVVTQSGADNHIIVEDLLPRNNVNVSIAVDSVSQPGSIIRNCTVNGTLRFRSPVTVEDSTLNLMYAWIDNLPNIEGPVPRDIHFKNCRITKVQAPLAVDSYVSPDRIMVIGSYCTDGRVPEYKCTNITFEDCEVNHNAITFYRSSEVTFVRDGKVYYQFSGN